MKKIIFLLLFTISFYGQTLQNPTYGTVTEKNNATDNTPAYFVTSQTDGVHKKTPAALIEKTDNKQNSLAVDGTGVKYPTVDAINAGLGVVQKDVAYVDINGNNSTAILGNIRKPFLTIDAALDALPAGGGVVKIGHGSFNSPTPAKIKANTAFIGSKEPIINSTVTISAPNTRPTITAPTSLINGTILTGEFSALDKNNIVVSNLGIDVGKTWVDTFNGGVPVGGLEIKSITATAPIKGIQVSNVTVLGYAPTTAQHCMLFENIVDSKFNNLSTYYNVHGLAIKGINLTINGLKSHSHSNDGLIIKSDTYAPTRNVTATNINITSLSGYEGSGIILEEGALGSSPLSQIDISNVNISYANFGLININKVNDINISNLNLFDINVFGIKFNAYADRINLNNISGRFIGTEGLEVVSSSGKININNVSLTNIIGYGYSLTTSSTGEININNSNIINTTNSYYISGTGVYGSSNLGDGIRTGVINFKSTSIFDNGKVGINQPSPNGAIDVLSGNIANSLTFNSNSTAIFGSAIRQLAINASDTNSVFDISLQARTNGGASATLRLNPLGGSVLIGSLAGAGTRQVVADASGNLSATNTIDSQINTGTPTAPTAPVGTNTTQIATTAFVQNAVSGVANSGTYTPTLTPSNTTIVAGTTYASYTKNGNIVHVTVSFQVTPTINQVPTITVTLPFNRANTTNINAGGAYIWDSSTSTVIGGQFYVNNTSSGVLRYRTGAGVNAQDISLNFTYDISR